MDVFKTFINAEIFIHSYSTIENWSNFVKLDLPKFSRRLFFTSGLSIQKIFPKKSLNEFAPINLSYGSLKTTKMDVFKTFMRKNFYLSI